MIFSRIARFSTAAKAVNLNIAFVGAGQVNFGGGEGPWNHAKRVEMLKTINQNGTEVPVNFNVVAIADPYPEHAKKVLEKQRSISTRPEIWQNTKIYNGYMDMLKNVQNIDAVWIGTPPEAHGSTKPGADIELQCAKNKINLFVEKPISCYPVLEINKLASELDALVKQHNLVISVGYMFRYSQAVRKIKEIIAKYGTPRIFNARYNCAYETISKVEWWDNDKCGGPIVEQGTHFADLARYIVGEVDLNSVYANAIMQTDPLGKLSAQSSNVGPFENSLPEERRIVRSTAATWKFENGALGTFTHGVLLHGKAYETELEVWGDGYRVSLVDPYNKCRLAVRFPDSEETKMIEFGSEDVYYEEVKTFVEAIANGGKTDNVASTYADAVQTYRLTWKIRESAEKNHSK